MVQTVRNLPAIQESQVQSLGLERLLEKEVATPPALLGNSMDRGTWLAAAHGVAESQT